MLAGLGETWVITRKDYEVAIEQALPSLPERENLRFVYVDFRRDCGVTGPARPARMHFCGRSLPSGIRR
jgi:hypothetical protein